MSLVAIRLVLDTGQPRELESPLTPTPRKTIVNGYRRVIYQSTAHQLCSEHDGPGYGHRRRLGRGSAAAGRQRASRAADLHRHGPRAPVRLRDAVRILPR